MQQLSLKRRNDDGLFCRIGVSVEGTKTTRQAIEMAGLDWETEKSPIDASECLAGSGQKIINHLEEAHAIIRKKDRKVLGIVQDRYHLFQNTDVFQFLDNLVAKNFISLRRAGTFHDDKILWLLLELPKPIQVKWHHRKHLKRKDVQRIRRFFVATVSHELDSSVELHMLPTREHDGVELNFVKSAAGLRVNHHAHFSQELARGLASFVTLAERYIDYDNTVQALNDSRITEDKVQQWITHALPNIAVPGTRALGLLLQEMVDDTMFSAVAAMCQLVDTLPECADIFGRWTGQTSKLKQQAFRQLAQFLT